MRAERESRTRYVGITITLGVGLLLIVLQAFGAFGGGSRTLRSTTPMPLAIVYLLLGPISLVIPIVVFWSWSLFLFRGQTTLLYRGL